MGTVISMFAGIGGICLGFRQAGFSVAWANERDHAACLTYRHNIKDVHLLEADIRSVSCDEIPNADVLTAGFPCQSFSASGAQRGFNDERGKLFFEVIRIANEIKPRILFLENVENLVEHDNGRTFQVVYSSLAGLGYYIRYQVMPSHEYSGIPQTRRRIYIVAFLDLNMCEKFQFPLPMSLTTNVSDWIKISEKAPDIYYFQYGDPFDEYVIRTVTDFGFIYRIFDKKITKLKNRKCPTLTASMTSKYNAAALRDIFGVRRMTLHEALMFQGFPKDYYFPASITMEEAYKQIGNSVTVPVIQRIAERIQDVLAT